MCRDILVYMNTQQTFSPFNGEISYDVKETIKSISIQTVDDDIPEQNAVYMLRIIDVDDDVILRDRAVISSINNSAEIQGK